MSEKKAHILQLAWASGVFDSRALLPRSGYTVRLESVDEDLMKRFHATVNVGRITKRQKKGMARPLFLYQTMSMDDTRTLLLTVAPFLSASRTKYCAELVARIERNPIWQQKNPEKAASLVTYPVQTAEAATTEPSTTPVGLTATQ